MKLNFSFGMFLRVALIAIASVTALSSSSAQQMRYLQLELGALQLGYTTNGDLSMLTDQQLANAFTQGANALNATNTAAYPYVVGSLYIPAAQTPAFRSQLYNASLFSLTHPFTYTNQPSPVNVLVTNPTTHTLTTNSVNLAGSNGFYPQLINPAGTLNFVSARVPNLNAGIISNVVAASLSTTTVTNNGNVIYIPVYWTNQPSDAQIAAATNAALASSLNNTTHTAQITNASTAAAAAISQTLATYTSGTKNWPQFPNSGPATNTLYLPNYSTNPIGTNPITAQQPNLKGMANAAAAVAASAINGLGTRQTPTSGQIYGITQSSVQLMTRAMINAIAPLQATSTYTNATTKSYASFGVLSSASLGITTQVSGKNNASWASYPSFNAFLTGVVNGVVLGVKNDQSLVPYVVRGVAQGFYLTYLKTATGTPISESLFNTQNNSAIVNTFFHAGATNSTYLVNGAPTALSNIISDSFTFLNKQWTNNALSNVAGASGINFLTTNSVGFFNGVGSPVTDTQGLN